MHRIKRHAIHDKCNSDFYKSSLWGDIFFSLFFTDCATSRVLLQLKLIC